MVGNVAQGSFSFLYIDHTYTYVNIHTYSTYIPYTYICMTSSLSAQMDICIGLIATRLSFIYQLEQTTPNKLLNEYTRQSHHEVVLY